MIAWFRSKRTLIADIDRQRDMLTARDETITYLNEVIEEGAGQAEIRVARLQESLRHALRGTETERRLRVAAEGKLAQVVEELRKLRSDIREAEGNLPSATGVGMARSPLAARLQSRPLPADLADAIDEETDMKRRLDGLGD